MISFFSTKKPKRTPITLYNTLGREKQEFHALKGRFVKMYTCGPTVYDYAHIGNLRSYIFADILRRTLQYGGYSVKQIINITDVGHLQNDADEGEDKMTAGLKREGMDLNLENMKILAERYATAFIEDIKELNIELPFGFPRASEHIPEQIAFIDSLVAKGYAYAISDGIYFDTAKFSKYGILGGTGASTEHSRIGINSEKRHAEDFTLWKLSVPAETAAAAQTDADSTPVPQTSGLATGQAQTNAEKQFGWDSPWGKGFPGWHIECTAMSTKYLGKSFDVHTGGIDHIPIHHNNEIAQTEAATGKPYARYWLHGAFITVEGKRIGKSEGNAIRLYQLKERGVNPLAYRYLVLMAHYRSPMNFTWDALSGAQSALYRALRIFADLPRGGRIIPAFREKFESAVNDDLNTAEGIAVMWELLHDDAQLPAHKRATLLDFDRVLGLGFGATVRQGSAEKLSVVENTDLPEEVGRLIAEREEARKGGDWSRADTLRSKIKAEGYSVEDTKDGPEVRKSDFPLSSPQLPSSGL